MELLVTKRRPRTPGYCGYDVPRDGHDLLAGEGTGAKGGTLNTFSFSDEERPIALRALKVCLDALQREEAPEPKRRVSS